MYTIRIGQSEKPLSEATESWIVQQVQQRKEDNRTVCVQVILKDASINFTLTTPACVGGGGTWEPNRKEQEIVDLWIRRRLNQVNWAVGDLIAFLKQLRKLI